MVAHTQASWPFSKTKMCKFHIMGQCTRGKACVFAHAAEELQPSPDLARTKLCKTLLSTGKCQNPHCTYAHNKEELRSGMAVDRSLRGKGPQTAPRNVISTAKQISAGSLLSTPAIWGNELALSAIGAPWSFGWHAPLETNLTCISVGDNEPHASFVDKLEDVETCSGISETFSAAAISEESHADQEGVPMYITVGMQMCAPPVDAPLKLIRSADGKLCALGDV
jgi:hypothetical protein